MRRQTHKFHLCTLWVVTVSFVGRRFKLRKQEVSNVVSEASIKVWHDQMLWQVLSLECDFDIHWYFCTGKHSSRHVYVFVVLKRSHRLLIWHTVNLMFTVDFRGKVLVPSLWQAMSALTACRISWLTSLSTTGSASTSSVLVSMH